MERATNLSTRYFKMKSIDLRRLESQKQNSINRLRAKPLGYFDQQEIRKLEDNLKWIRAVLASREGRLEMNLV